MIVSSSLIKLVAAHLLGDFILQPDSLCQSKQSDNPKLRYSGLALHSLIQALLSYLFIADWTDWQVPIVICVSHFMIDLLKVKSERYDLVSFIVDQILHYIVIVSVWWFMLGGVSQCADCGCTCSSFWIVLTACALVLKPCSIFIKLFMEKEGWTPTAIQAIGLPNAGKWIGYLERILIVAFITTGNFEGVGFLLAAKSVFRFGELNKARDIRITEYILIGTFLSFTIAVLVGLTVNKLLPHV